MVMINGDCIFVKQALMLASYCKKVKLYLENTQIKNMFALEYSKAIRIKRREEEIQEANANLKHKGQMLMYTAADCGYDEINANLERDKGKRKAATANEEEDSEDKGSVGQENLDNEDEDDRGNEKRLRQETPSDTEEHHDVSFLTTTSGGTYQNSVSSNSSPYIAYVTSLDEIKPMTLENLGEVRYMSKSEPVIDRLMYSGIDFVDACEDRQYTPGILDDNIHSFVDQFVRAVRYKDGNLLLSPLKPELVNITILLLSCHFNILKEYRIQQLNFQSYRPVENQDNRETDYKMKYVVPFINSVFHVNDRFQIYWDVPFDFYDCSNMSIQRRQTSDAKFVEIGGLEIGAVEIKSFHTAAVDIDNDIVRLGKKRARTESHVSPTTIAQSVLASQPNNSNGSKTEEIDLTTAASKYATIDPVASNAGGSTSTNPSPEQTVDKYSDIEIDDIDDSDYVPPEESEGSSGDSQDEEKADKMLIDSQEVEELQHEENNQVVFAQYSRKGAVVTHSSSDDKCNISEPLL
ncbi:hypothetical protein G6F37_010799 [Rhizopus arrhizus]|nr:hypothetical protein G6F38_010844 [Rhizopus arrhizus]KAG1152400.1 hypothetical protein G6F37_010799 [Rhizopus arrhizus]